VKKVLVVQGGLSTEKEVSKMSGMAVSEALKDRGYQVITYDLTDDLSAFTDALKREKPDVVFNALHGKYGEDGCIQGLLNLMKIPYTHSGVLASAIGMDKNMTRELVQTVGVSVPKGKLMTREEPEPTRPYVVKPNDEGSSTGVFIVRNDSDRQAAEAAWPTGRPMLVEQYIPGRELTVAVWDGQAVGVLEIVPKTGYYDFSNKYTAGATEHIVPANIPEPIYRQVTDWAEKAHRILGCRGVSRSDFRLDDVTDPKNPKAYFLEVNTNPGMTKLSLVPDLLRVCRKMSFPDVVAHLVEEATCDR
jgi:D-alanine-D-alanine ligase